MFCDNNEHRASATISCQQLTLCFTGTRAQPQVQECGRFGKGYFPAVSQCSDLQPGGLSGEAAEFLSFKGSSLHSVIVVVNGILTVVKQNPSSVRASVCACVCTFFSLFFVPPQQLQIYEDSIVIKSVFESARQRIVTNEEQKETVGASLSDNGGGTEDQFVPSAGESRSTNTGAAVKTNTCKTRTEGAKFSKLEKDRLQVFIRFCNTFFFLAN